jgi:cell division protein FtsL
MDVPMEEPNTATLGTRARLRRRQQALGNRLRNGLAERVRQLRLASRVILVGLLLSFAGIIWLNQTSTIVSIGYDMQNIDKKIITLNRQAEILQSQVAEFENLKRVEEEAKNKLGMVTATKFVYVKVPQTEAPSDNGAANPKLYPVNDWWRELTEMLPRPWQGSAPAQK